MPCLGLTEQVAQKIHALTEPLPRGRPNARARDVLDILLLDARLQLDTSAIASACASVFARRMTHQLPVLHCSFPPEWSGMLPELALQAAYDTTDVNVIELRFNAFLIRLNEAASC